jgi:hypothetical protein
MSDASFVLDIATTMTGGEQTIAQMDALTGKLIAAGVSASTFQDAVVAASNALTSSKAATAAANAALAEGNTKYRELEQAANQAAKAQEKAARLGVVRPEIAAAANAASAALSAHEAELRKLEQAAKAAAAKENELGTSLANVKKLASATAAETNKAAAAESRAASQSDRNLKKLRSGLAGVGGPLGSLGAASASAVDDFRDLEEVIGTAGARMAFVAGAAASVVAGLVIMTAAVVAATIAIAAWAVGLADTRRAAALNQEAVEALDPAIAALSGSYASITAQTGQTVPQLNALAKSLTAAKVSAEDMPEALRAAALAEAALGQGGSAKFLEDLKKGKVAVGQLSKEAQSKLGGIVAKQMLGLDAQAAKLKANVSQIFGGLNIDPVLAGLQRLVALFDENTAAGEAIKFLFESVFQPLINQADKAAIVIEAFALGFLIGLTRLYIALKPVVRAIAEFFGFDDPTTADTLDMVKVAGEFVASAFIVFIGILGALGVALAAVVVFLNLPLIALAALSVGVYMAGVAIYDGFVSAWNAVGAFLSSFSLVQIGTDIVAGLVSGIINMGPNVLKAITGVAHSAIAAAKNALGIASPSKVFAEIGGYTAEGFAEGVDEGAPSAQSALERLADPSMAAASAGGASGGGAGAGGGGGKPLIDMRGAQFVFQGVANAEQAESRFEEMFTRLLEGEALRAEGGATA